MGFPSRPDALPMKGLLPWGVLLLVLNTFFYASSGTNHVSKAVKEMAALSCGYTISPEELDKVRVYWQKDNRVVLSIVSGKVEVWPEYKNRTFTDIPNNLTLVIGALRLSDKGTYVCVVQKKDSTSFKKEHLASVTLSIRADFPVPHIKELENPLPNTERIVCSTSGGFPKPQLSWWENGKELNATNTTVSQNSKTELYTVSSELDFNRTSNHIFVCRVEYGDLAVSQNYSWKAPEDSPGNQSPSLEYVKGILIGIGIAIAIASIIIFKRSCRSRRDGPGVI